MHLFNGGSLDQLLRRFQRDVDRMYDQVSRGRSALSSYPALNLQEDGECFYVEAELPGYVQDDLQVYILGGEQLVLKGERKQPELEKAVCHRHRRERAFGKFSRTLPLPAAVDPDKVEARLEQGVLRLKLAKSAAARSKRITVTS